MLQSVEKFNVSSNIRENYMRNVDICTHIIPSSTPFEIWKTGLDTQIMLLSQFVEF
jgi:hypothetical protein